MVAADGICRTFGSGHTAVHALRGVSLTVDRGQLVALRGRSGSGKTTLLNIIGGLDDPTAGRVWVDGREVNRMPERERLTLRRETVAFIFQSFGSCRCCPRRRMSGFRCASRACGPASAGSGSRRCWR
ncbi:MAG: ATP-binding cassette domain-containing protein [Streptosporangiaceae bacterium]